MSSPVPRQNEDRPGSSLPSPSRTDAILTTMLFFVGALLCFSYLFSSAFGPTVMAVLATTWTGSFFMAQRATSRALRWTAAVCSLSLYLAALYATVLFVAVLGWSLPLWTIAVLAATALAALATARRPWGQLRVPAVLPVGLLMALAASGWWSEGGRVRCDDLFHLQEQSDVALMIPSLEGLSTCRPGATVPLRRYPRQIWESTDEKTFVFTTQKEPFASETEDGFDGSVCAAQPASGRLRCLGSGKGEQIVEIGNDRLLVMNAEGAEDGALYAFRRDDVFGDPTIVKIGRAGTGFYDAPRDTVYVLGDDATMLTPVRASDLQPGAPVPIGTIMLADIGPYDTARHLGLLCGPVGPLGALLNGGRPYLATKLHAEPLGVESLGDSPLAWVAVSFGCDWDLASGRVFIALPNLGAVADVDFDSGRLLGIGRAEIGLRMLRFDAKRHRLYAGNFLAGYVVELDADSKRQLRRWFVGRFARDVRLTRDGGALLVASNLGIVRIAL